MRSVSTGRVALAAVWLLLPLAASAQEIEDAKLLPSDVAAYEYAGWSVAISGDTALVGSGSHEHAEIAGGAVWVFERADDDWTELQELLSPDPAAGEAFGGALAIDGDLLVVGSSGDTGDRGAAYVFRFDDLLEEWVHDQKLVAGDGAVGDRFGWSVSISEEVVAVGAPKDSDAGTSSGSAYVFRYDGAMMDWGEEQKLTADDADERDEFGHSVSVSGSIVAIGAPRDDDNLSNSGSAYVFRYDDGTSDWVQEDKLLPMDGAAADVFGYSVAVSGSDIVVGAPGDSGGGGRDSGTAYLFRAQAGEWTEGDKLYASDAVALAEFGRAVSLDSGVAVIGARFDTENGTNAGAAYAFQGPARDAETKLLPSDGAAQDQCGYSVAVSDGMAVVGAWQHDAIDTNAGGAYVFPVPEAGSAAGLAAALSALGALARARPRRRLHASS